MNKEETKSLVLIKYEIFSKEKFDAGFFWFTLYDLYPKEVVESVRKCWINQSIGCYNYSYENFKELLINKLCKYKLSNG